MLGFFIQQVQERLGTKDRKDFVLMYIYIYLHFKLSSTTKEILMRINNEKKFNKCHRGKKISVISKLIQKLEKWQSHIRSQHKNLMGLDIMEEETANSMKETAKSMFVGISDHRLKLRAL